MNGNSAKATKPAESNIFLEWEAPSRPFKTRSREFYKTAIAISVLISLILVFMGEFLLIGVIAATMFVIYALSSVPPGKIRNRITNLGIESDDHFHKWEEMYEFWFDEKYGEKMLVVRLLFGFPSHLQLLLDDAPMDKIKSLLTERIPFREKPERTFLDRASEWMAKNLPLERTS